MSVDFSENISNKSQDLFTKHYINKDTRGYALTQIFKNYKTIIVTDHETKNSKVISFKGLYHYNTSVPTNENLLTEASVSTTKRSQGQNMSTKMNQNFSSQNSKTGGFSMLN